MENIVNIFVNTSVTFSRDTSVTGVILSRETLDIRDVTGGRL